MHLFVHYLQEVVLRRWIPERAREPDKEKSWNGSNHVQPTFCHALNDQTVLRCRPRCFPIRSRFHIQREARVGAKKGRKFGSRVPIQSSLVFHFSATSGPVRTDQNTRIYLRTTLSYNKRCSLQSELTQIRFPSGYPSNVWQLISVRTKTPEKRLRGPFWSLSLSWLHKTVMQISLSVHLPWMTCVLYSGGSSVYL